jgi:hypothetical protein
LGYHCRRVLTTPFLRTLHGRNVTPSLRSWRLESRPSQRAPKRAINPDLGSVHELSFADRTCSPSQRRLRDVA